VECLDLLNIALKACKKDSLLYANLLNTKGGVENKRNHSEQAYAAFFESRRIRENLLPKDDEEIANTYNNLGNVYQSDCKYEEALDLHRKALAIDMNKVVEERKKIVHIRYLNIGNTYAFQGKCIEAREYIEKGRTHAIEIFGAHTHYDAV
jgi:tetratricopeptide (TPR) repeat protein